MPYVSYEDLMRDAELLASMQADSMQASTRIAGLRAEVAMLRAAAKHLLDLLETPFDSENWLDRMDGATAALRELLKPFGLNATEYPARRIKSPPSFEAPFQKPSVVD